MLDIIVFGNPLRLYLFVFCLFIVVYSLLIYVKNLLDALFLRYYYESVDYRQDFFSLLRDIVIHTPRYFLFCVAGYISFQFLSFPSHTERIITAFLFVPLFVYILYVVQRIVRFFVDQIVNHDESIDEMTHEMIWFVVKIAVWILGILILLVNLGVEITPLLASLGIGGIAIAFAMQNILQDLFSSLMIYISKPFKIGDYVSFGLEQGIVKDISFQMTRIKTLAGHTVTIPNKDVLSSRILNFSDIEKRRRELNLLLPKDLSPKKIASVQKKIAKLFDTKESISFVRAVISTINEMGIVMDVVYEITESNFDRFLEMNNDLILDILGIFEKEHVVLASVPYKINSNKM